MTSKDNQKSKKKYALKRKIKSRQAWVDGKLRVRQWAKTDALISQNELCCVGTCPSSRSPRRTAEMSVTSCCLRALWWARPDSTVCWSQWVWKATIQPGSLSLLTLYFYTNLLNIVKCAQGWNNSDVHPVRSCTLVDLYLFQFSFIFWFQDQRG